LDGFPLMAGNRTSPTGRTPGVVLASVLDAQRRTVANCDDQLPLFPVRTPEIFFERLLAFKPDPATGKPDPLM